MQQEARSTIREVTAQAAAWARGCTKCKFGIVDSVPLTGAVEMHMERMIHALDGNAVFCECEAGQAYRARLLNMAQKLREELKRRAATDPQWKVYQEAGFHPEILIARGHIENSPKYLGEQLTEPTFHGPEQPELMPGEVQHG